MSEPKNQSRRIERWWQMYKGILCLTTNNSEVAAKLTSDAVDAFYTIFPNADAETDERCQYRFREVKSAPVTILPPKPHRHVGSGPVWDFLQRNGIKLTRFARESGVNQSTVARACGIVYDKKHVEHPSALGLNVMAKMLATARGIEPSLTGPQLFGQRWENAVNQRLKLPIGSGSAQVVL